jgi:hypothetical protein
VAEEKTVMTARPSARSHLRLVIEPTHEDQQSWYAQAERDARLFLLRCGHQLSDPSLTHWVVEQCAELAWHWRAGRPAWSALRVGEVWLRLANLHRFFPQPRLVVAFYDTLLAFLPWLASQGRLDHTACRAMLEQLERAREPMLERAREQLAARHRFRQRVQP